MEIIKLSPYHKIFYNEWKLNPSSSKYNIVLDQTISSNLNISRLRKALERFVGDYLLVNSHVELINNEPCWVINETIKQLEYFVTKESDYNLFEYVSKAFNIESQPLYRFAIFCENNGNYRFILVFHHLIIDSSSLAEYVDQISHYYNDEMYEIQSTLDDQAQTIISTTEILAGQLEQTKTIVMKFWQRLLSRSEPVDLRFLKSAGTLNNSLYINPIKELSFEFEYKCLKRLFLITRKYVITPYIYSKCIFMLLLYKYTSQNEFAFGYPVAINEHAGLVYGAGVNTNIFPCNVTPSSTILDLIKYTKAVILDCKHKSNHYRYYPINMLLPILNKGFLDIVFTQTVFRNKIFTFDNAKSVSVNTGLAIDINSKVLFEQCIHGNIFEFTVRYDSRQIDEVILKQFIMHYQKLFLNVLRDLENGITTKQLLQYSALTLSEYKTIIYQWNHTDQIYPEHKTIHQLFEEQVQRTPNNIALVYENIQLTYKELNNRSNQLANYLITTYDLNRDELIALYINRNELMLITILATLKSGAAYVPISPDCPSDNLKFILQDTQSKVILTNRQHLNKIQKNIHTKSLNLKFIAIDTDIIQTKLNQQATTNPITKITSNDLAYVIYTSGTTGIPKGVMVEHTSVTNLLKEQSSVLFKKNNHIYKSLWYSSYTFDAHVWEIYATLISGHTLYLISDSMRFNINELACYIKSTKIDIATIPPALLTSCPIIKLDTLILAGESISSEVLTKLLKDNTRIFNAYGLTESTVCSTLKQITKGDSQLIGRPISNTKCYILDNNLNPLPVGAIGELYISGVGLARGYLNQPKLTQEKFIYNPFQTIADKSCNKNGRLYKTGDLVRYLSNGNLEYIGRIDSQIKINGYRIELGEIENSLMSHPEIKAVAVLVHEFISDVPKTFTNRLLVAYYVSNNLLNALSLHNYLVNKLPSYMIPQIFMHIKNLPLTINGKLDKKALPVPDYTSINSNFILPRTNKEQIICDAFASILNLQYRQWGIDDDFFVYGGNSILAIRLVVLLQKYFTVNVTDIFKYSTPRMLAKKLSFSTYSIKDKINLIKNLYTNTQVKTSSKNFLKYTSKYLRDAYQLKFTTFMLKPIKNVLLTGTPGFLGCNLLYGLLKQTNYNIYLLVRGKSDQDAYIRVEKQFKYYFSDDLLSNYASRISVLCGSLDKYQLDLTTVVYEALTKKIDSVIHSAALIKHYGDYNEFYNHNVKATINLLKFTQHTQLKDFHYVSTYSVLQCMDNNSDPNKFFYTEENVPSDRNIFNSSYVYTKLLGEHQVIQYRELGVNTNIYRVGNLAYMARNYKLPYNFMENAFFNTLCCITEIGKIAKEISSFEISPVDITATAIIKLFDKPELNNRIWHVFNPYKFDITQINIQQLNIKVVPFEIFIENLSSSIDVNAFVLKLILRQGWLSSIKHIKNSLNIDVLQTKTQLILKQLDFEWPRVDPKRFIDVLKNIAYRNTLKM